MRKHLQFSVVLTAVAMVATGAGLRSEAGDLPAPGTVSIGSSGVNLVGSVDAYFTYNFNEPANSDNPGVASQNLYRAYDRGSRQFQINETTVGFTKAADPVGFSLQVGQGTLYSVLNANESDTGFQYVRDANVSYESGKFSVVMGRFDSGFGFENITSAKNWNYSRGLQFTNAQPYFYTGAKAAYSFGSGWMVGAGVVNGVDRFSDNNVGKTLPIVIGWGDKDTNVTANAVLGSEADGSSRNLRRTLGFTASHMYSKMVGLAIDGTWMNEHDGIVIPASSKGPATKRNADVYALSGYLMTSFWDNHQDNLRLEWFRDNDGLITATARNISAITLTHRYMVTKNMSFWGEFRYDTSEVDSFYDDNGLVKKNNQSTLTVAATLQI